MQRRLLYQPERISLEEGERRARALGLKAWPEPAPEASGWLGAAPDKARGTIVVLHGNAGEAVGRAHYVEALAPLGWRVLLYEYPGYGARSGTPSESSIAQDGALAARRARAAWPDGPLVLWGESLGAGAAASIARRAPEAIDGVVMMTPWDSFGALARHYMGWVPVSWLIRDPYDSVANLNEAGVPVAVVVAGRDEVIPPARGLALYEGLKTPRALIVLEEATHNGWSLRDPSGFARRALEFAAGGGG